MQNDKISFAVFEAACSRLERTIKRLWILLIVVIILLVGSNALWIIYERQFEHFTEIQQEAEWDDNSNVILNGTGNVNYGESKTDNN